MFIIFWRWNISFFLLLWFPFICVDSFWVTIWTVCSLSMDTSQIRTNIASLPLLYNIWSKTVHMAIMSLKVLPTMEGNSFALMLHGSDFLEIQSETQAEFREQKHSCYLQHHLWLCQGLSYKHIHGKLVLSSSQFIEQSNWGARRIDLNSCSLKSGMAFKKGCWKKKSVIILPLAAIGEIKKYLYESVCTFYLCLMYRSYQISSYFFILITRVIFGTCTSTILEVLGSVVAVAFYISQLRLK